MDRTTLVLAAAALVAAGTAGTLPAHAEDPVKDLTTVTMSEPTLTVVRFGKGSTISGKVSGVADLVSTQRSRAVSLAS